MPREEEQKALFLAEALDQYEELNRLFTQLEKDHADTGSIKAIFRITHTMKANAAAMGLDGIASLAHLLEDIFSLIKGGEAKLDSELFNDLFRANDKLGDLINSIKTQKRVSYKGMATKLKVILRELKGQEFKDDLSQDSPPQQEDKEASTQKEDSPATEEGQQTEEDRGEGKAKEEEATQPQEAGPADTPSIAFSDFIQVPVKKLDQLMNLVGELVIERDRLMTEKLKGEDSQDYASLYRVSADLQYAVMSVRLVKVNILFAKFHRIVRDVANYEKKAVDLVLSGTEIEIDRNVLNTISESLIHLVRNAISHGIEDGEGRKLAGKPDRGKVELSARNDKDSVIIDVIDDGKGVDADIMRRKAVEKGLMPEAEAQSLPDQDAISLIFESGFSSRDQVSEVSGRGVGMDAVKQSIESIGGEISMETQVGKGSTFSMVLPSSMAVKKALLFEVQGNTYALPLTFIDSVVQMKKEELHKVGKGLIAPHNDHTVNILFLQDLFESHLHGHAPLQKGYERLQEGEIINTILIQIKSKWVGIAVDRLIHQQEIIEKPLAAALQQARFVSGATILGDGNVCLVIDVLAVGRALFK